MAIEWPELDRAWHELKEAQEACTLCSTDGQVPLICQGAKPLFGKFNVWENGVLFIFEAPNEDDTFNPSKGYLTYDNETDPTGRFARLLMVEEMGLHPDNFQVTNSVLCLPAKKNGKFTVGSKQRKLCSSRLREQISVLDPAVVVPVGGAALIATRQLEDHGYRKMLEAVGCPVQWLGRWLFPVFHTGLLARNGPGGRKESDQRRDWQHLRRFIEDQGVNVP